MKKLFALALLSTSFLMAADEPESSVQPVGTREVPAKERMTHQSDRSDREESAGSNSAAVARGLQVEYSSHMGAFHHPLSITPLGDLITMEDGSGWVVNYGDRPRTFNWLTSDTLKITPNHAWFSSYYFVVTNINTNESVEVNLAYRSTPNGLYTYWIVAIDDYNNQIVLNDGSAWKMSAFDSSVTRYWQPYDTVILGHNSGFFSSSKPNILINCETQTYAEGRCFY